jgi:RNA polymerase sigma-70 factor, ECF subfamily
MRTDSREVSESDRARFESLYRENVQAVLRFALARVRPEQAKDVVAETFLVTWRRIEEVPDQPTAWVLGVARRVIATQWRTEARRQALGLRLAGVPGEGWAASDVAEQVAERQSVLSAFGELSEADREILRLVAWDGLSPDQAATVLGVTRLAFGVRLHRARRRFVSRLAASEHGGASSPTRPGEHGGASSPTRPGEHGSRPARRDQILQAKEAH